MEIKKSRLEARKEELASKLLQVRLPYRKESSICWEVGSILGVSGVSIRNYLLGRISDGYLGEEILSVFEGMGYYQK